MMPQHTCNLATTRLEGTRVHRLHRELPGISESVDDLIGQIREELTGAIDGRLRTELARCEPAWLIDQIVALSLGSLGLAKSTVTPSHVAHAVRPLRLDQEGLVSFLDRYRGFGRQRLISEGYLKDSAPPPGDVTIGPQHRTRAGVRLLGHAKDMLHALLFGDESSGVRLNRTHRELLTVTLPNSKVSALDFLRSSTSYSVAGTWRDPLGSAHDERADNIVNEIEYGEVDDELVGDGIVRCLTLINHLQVNEQLLYARMIDVEQSTLCS